MNFSDIRYFIENQLKEAEQHPDSPEAGDALLLLADYLLEQVQNQPDAFTQTSGRELRRKFLRCSSMSRRISTFADEYGGAVAQETASSLTAIAQNYKKIEALRKDCESAEQQLDTLQKQEQEIHKQAQTLEQKNAALLAQKSALQKREQEAESLRKCIQECQRILTEITDQKLETMRDELKQLKPKSAQQKEQHDTLFQKLQELKKYSHDVQENIRQITKETDNIQQKISESETQLSELRNQKNIAEQTCTNLLRTIDEAGKEYEEFQELLKENRRIADRILKSGFVLDYRNSSDSFYVRIETLAHRAEDITEEYNTLLKNVLTDAKTLYQKILERQEPAYKN